MKSLLIIATLLSLSAANAFETGMGKNGPYTVGPLGYTDIFVTSAGMGVTIVGTTAGTSAGNPTAGSTLGTSASLNMKAIAVAVESDAQNYLQTGEMSLILGHMVELVQEQNAEVSVEEAVSVVLAFAEIHINN